MITFDPRPEGAIYTDEYLKEEHSCFEVKQVCGPKCVPSVLMGQGGGQCD